MSPAFIRNMSLAELLSAIERDPEATQRELAVVAAVAELQEEAAGMVAQLRKATEERDGLCERLLSLSKTLTELVGMVASCDTALSELDLEAPELAL